MYSITFVLVLFVVVVGVDCKSNATAATTATHAPVDSVLYVPLNGTFELDCDTLEAHVLAGGEKNTSATTMDGLNTTATATTAAAAPSAVYSVHMFKKDELVVQVNNPRYRVAGAGLGNEGHYECGSNVLDKFGRFNYVLRKAWTVKITVPKVEVKTTTEGTSGEVFVTQENLTDSVYLEGKNINIFTYSNPAIIFVLVAGFLVICATFLVVILLFNVRTCRSCQRTRGKELL